jgi:hypothetical protein
MAKARAEAAEELFAPLSASQRAELARLLDLLL